MEHTNNTTEVMNKQTDCPNCGATPMEDQSGDSHHWCECWTANETSPEPEAIKNFVERLGITSEAKLVDSNPDRDDDEWSRSATHYFVTLGRHFHGQNRKMDVYFSQGPAITGEPTAEDVLDCLASDVTSVENADGWLDWAKEMGYTDIEDADRARESYEEIQKQRKKLDWLLGEEELEKLLYGTERL